MNSIDKLALVESAAAVESTKEILCNYYSIFPTERNFETHLAVIEGFVYNLTMEYGKSLSPAEQQELLHTAFTPYHFCKDVTPYKKFARHVFKRLPELMNDYLN